MYHIYTCLFIILLPTVLSTQVDTFNVLLPVVSINQPYLPTQLISTKGNGCYEWQSSQPQVINIEGHRNKDEKCIRNGLLTLRHRGQWISSVQIRAMDIQQKQVVNIPVRIRQLSKIIIFTKSKTMNVKEYQELFVYGFDKDNNTFTSLQGIRFKWTFIQQSTIISKVNLKDSNLYMPTDQRKIMQQNGYETDALVIKGQQIGKVILKITCVQDNYKHLSHIIRLWVFQKFQIYPHEPLYMLVQSKFQFSLISLTSQPLSLPQSFYKMTLSNDFHITNSLLLTAGSKPSQSILRVEDIRTQPASYSQLLIYSYQADEIIVVIDEFIVINQNIPFKVQLYNQHRLLKGMPSQLQIMSSIFNINMTNNSLLAYQKGIGEIKVLYRGIEVIKKITAVLPLKIVLPTEQILLPIDQSFEIKILGGTGLYQYSIPSSIATITQTGLIITKEVGQTAVIITDRKHQSRKLNIKLTISKIDHIHTLQRNKQTNIDQLGHLYIIGMDQYSRHYTQCDEMQTILDEKHQKISPHRKPIFWKVMGELKNFKNNNQFLRKALKSNSQIKDQLQFQKKFQLYTSDDTQTKDGVYRYIYNLQNYGICSIMAISFNRDLNEKIGIRMKYNSQINTNINLRVYEHIENLMEDKLLVTPQAGVHLNLVGGSYAWGSIPTIFYQNKESIISDDPYIQCPQYETVMQIELMIKNQPTQDLLMPVNQTKDIVIQCKLPSSLKFVYDDKVLNPSNLYVYSETAVIGHVYAEDDKGHRFHNDSNLKYRSEATFGEIILIQNNFIFNLQENLQSEIKIKTSSIINGKINFQKIEKSFTVKKIKPFNLQHACNETNIILLIHNSQKPYLINGLNLSRLTQVQCSDNIKCQFGINSSTVQIYGEKLGEGMVVLRDQLPYGFPQKIIRFQVVNPDIMTISTTHSYLQIDDTVQIEVVLSHRQRPIHPIHYELSQMYIMLPAGLKETSQIRNIFTIKGGISNKYTVYAEIRYPLYIKSRNSIDLEVYPKITVNLKEMSDKLFKDVWYIRGKIYVIDKCRRTLTIGGGPKGDVSIETSISQNNIVQISASSDGTFELKALKNGQSTLKMMMFVDENILIYVIDITVYVEQIQQITIFGNNIVLKNAQFRLIPNIVVNDNKVTNYQCNHHYQWFHTHPSVLILGNSIDVNNIISIGINVTAFQVGQSDVTLIVKDQNQYEIAKVQKKIQVVPNHYLQMDKLISEDVSKATSLLIPPNSGIELHHNWTATILTNCHDKLISIDKNKVKTNDKLGTSVLKLTTTNKQPTYTEYVNVVITPISALHIHNIKNIIQIQKNGFSRIKFYVQDSYGRLFTNKLFNMKYILEVSNPEVVSAFISSDKSYIELKGHKSGTSMLYLGVQQLQSTNIISAHDIVKVNVGVMMQPTSPVYVYSSGRIQFTMEQSIIEGWVSQDPSIIKINKNSGLAEAQKAGQTKIRINGLYNAVTVFQQISVKQIQPLKFKIYFKVDGQQKIISNINDPTAKINNNIKLNCETAFPNQYITSIKIINDKYNGQIAQCKIKPILQHISKVKNVTLQQISNEIQLSIIETSKEKILGSFKAQIDIPFYISEKDYKIQLTPTNAKKQISVDTHKKLKVQAINGSQEWFSTYYDDNKKKQFISIEMSNVKGQKSWIIEVKSLQADKYQQLWIHYSGQVSIQSKTWYMSEWQWTDYLVIIMAINFVCICIYQFCSEKKFKTL